MKNIILFDRPIAFHREYAVITGSVNAGLFLSQAVYWSKRTNDPEKWFWKTQEEWEEETTLSRRKQETARRTLKYLGILEEELRGIPAKLFYRINTEKLEELLTNKYGGFGHTGMDFSANPSITENTTEITCNSESTLSQGNNSLEEDFEVVYEPERPSKEKKTRNVSAEVSDFVELFREINPTYKRMLMYAPQISAAERLLEIHDFSWWKEFMSAYEKEIENKYCPKATTPFQMEEKFGAIMAYAKAKKRKLQSNVVAFV